LGKGSERKEGREGREREDRQKRTNQKKKRKETQEGCKFDVGGHPEEKDVARGEEGEERNNGDIGIG
jgi:hypothetical protein